MIKNYKLQHNKDLEIGHNKIKNVKKNIKDHLN